jgi:hypothetical protein
MHGLMVVLVYKIHGCQNANAESLLKVASASSSTPEVM